MATPDHVRTIVTECLRDPAYLAHLKEQVFASAIREAVAEAVADKDRQICQLNSQVSALSAQVNALEQYSRRDCINITGVPEEAGENTDELVINSRSLLPPASSWPLMTSAAVTVSAARNPAKLGRLWPSSRGTGSARLSTTHARTCTTTRETTSLLRWLVKYISQKT